MRNKKSTTALIITYLALLLGLVLCGSPTLVLAQFKPPDRGLPRVRSGGGTRGDCLQGEKSLTSLVPETGFGLTLLARPTLFWYVPPTAAQQAEFVLLDEDDKQMYKTTLKLTANPGVVSFSFTDNTTLPALEIGKNYHWQFSVICNPQEPSENPFVEGFIQRVVNPTLVNRLQQATPQSAIALYARTGIWHDALTTLARLRRSRPNDLLLTAQWANLLDSVKLETIANQPLVQCCTQVASTQANTTQVRTP